MQHQVNGPSQVTAAILAVILFQNVTNPLQTEAEAAFKGARQSRTSH